MRIQFDDLKEPVHIRVKHEGTVVYDETLQPGAHDINVDHPKRGVAEAFIVEDDGSEMLIATAKYGKGK